MPVLKVILDRFERMTDLTRDQIIDRLPFLGLDIEGLDEHSVRLEYNPNRPDFSTDYGIARALRGLVGAETGLREYSARRGAVAVRVDSNLAMVRPYMACSVARNLLMDDETVRQLISMQEDLHNGIGRRRKKIAIGLHNLDVLSPPLTYKGVDGRFSFVPLGRTARMSVAEVLEETEQGRAYGHLLSGTRVYPMLYDSDGTVLSFPPIVNGEATKVDTSTKNLLVDITSTDDRLGDDAMAVVSSALADAGAAIEAVEVRYDSRTRNTPDLSPTRMKFDSSMASRMTGLDLSASQMKACLERSRIGLDSRGYAVIPRYRTDIIHQVDLAEEVAIGYGLDRIRPIYPASPEPGRLSRTNTLLERLSDSMAREGFIEVLNYDLVDDFSLYESFSRPQTGRLEVENPRTLEHHVLRDALLPSLMSVLSRNVKAEYPQLIFEVGKVYLRAGTSVAERYRLAAVMAHSSASFSEAKMHLEALLREHSDQKLATSAATHWAFADGRCGEVLSGGAVLGFIGEVRPSAVASFGLDVPVAGFEIDLSFLVQNYDYKAGRDEKSGFRRDARKTATREGA